MADFFRASYFSAHYLEGLSHQGEGVVTPSVPVIPPHFSTPTHPGGGDPRQFDVVFPGEHRQADNDTQPAVAGKPKPKVAKVAAKTVQFTRWPTPAPIFSLEKRTGRELRVAGALVSPAIGYGTIAVLLLAGVGIGYYIAKRNP